tara:strand:+ start:2049 stop:5240 length:3192 start_codon:yes stop_codon:yes gene_type:complete
MKTAFSFLFLTLTLFLNAQDFTTTWLKEAAPRNIGPGGMSGRITSIDVVISNPNIIYVGTASGGLWKSSSGGVTWSPIFNDQVTASVGSVAIQQSNPDVIWVGTGEGNPRNSLNGGYGIFKSINGGKTWKSMGLENTRNIHRVIIDPSNPNTVYVAAIGSPWGEHPERGIYKTVNGGKSWKKILYVNDKTGAADLVIDPKNSNKLIAAMWEHKRDPWFFKSGGKGSGLYVSFDGGDNWSKKTKEDGLPDGDMGRIGLAIAANKTNIIYALVEAKKNALYKSEDGGFNWKMVNNKSDIGNRPFYYSDIAVDPQNENRVFSVFTYVNVSQDGGKNFSQLMPAYGVDNGIHPDHHAWWIHPNDGSFMIDGNDGGLNITRDGGKTWRFIGNIPVAQFYHISIDNEYPYNVYGGMQDNGSWRGPAYVWKVQGIRNSYWQEIAFGDGFDVVPDRDDSRYGYAMSQQGYVSRYDWKTGNNYIVRPTHPDPDTKLRFNWNAAIGQDPFDNSTVYFGSQFVHKSNDKGLTWSVISSDLTTNDPQKQKQSESGGLTLDATGAENYCTLLVIEPSPVEKNMLWVASDDGRVHFTQDGGDSWNEVTKNIKGIPKGSWITQIKASHNNKGEALLVANDYRRFNFKPYAYRTVNYGKTWERIVDQSDAKSYALSIIEDTVNPNLMFLGTDDGLYLSLNAGKKWDKFDPEVFPTVSVKDLVIQPREQDLIVGTFGRAAWVLDDIRPLRALALKPDLVSKKVHLFEPPTAYLAAYQQPTGSRFGADAMYQGTNRKYGAMMTYYVNPPSEEDSDQKKNKEEEEVKEKAIKDSLTLTIYDGDRLIRTLKKKLPKKKGLYRWYWYLNEKGFPRPRREPRKSKTEPSGVSIKPGTYRIVLEYGADQNEQQIVVKSDPRIQDYPENTESVYDTSKKLEGFMAKATESVKQLIESKQVLMDYQKLFKENKTESVKELTKEMKTQIKALDSLISLYIGKKDKRQGIIRNPESTVMTRMSTASRYIRSRKQGITSTEEKLLQHAKDELEIALEKTNTYYKKVWPSLRAQIEDLDSSRFKEVKLIDLD